MKRSLIWPFSWLPIALVAGGFCLGLLLVLKVALPLAVLAGLLLVALVWAFFHGSQLGQFWGKRSTRSGANTLGLTLVLLALLAAVNVLAVRYSTRWDLSENQLFTLSPQTQQVLRDLKQPIKIWAFNSDTNPNLRRRLEQYQRVNPRQVQYEIVDPKAKPDLARRLEFTQEQPLVIESGEQRRSFASLSESELTSNIVQITRNRQTSLAVLQGHGERSFDAPTQDGLSQAAAALGREGYNLTPLNLITSKAVPSGTDLLLLAGPRQPLLAGEVAALQAYLKQGGKLLLLAEPSTNPGLDALLKPYGVQLQPNLVIDVAGAQLAGGGPDIPIVTQFPPHPITREFANSGVIFAHSRSLTLTEVPAIEAQPLLQSTAQSWGEKDYTQTLEFTPGRDLQGPLNLAVAISQQTGNNAPRPQLVVFGSVDFAADAFFGNSRNGDLLLNAANWLTRSDDLLTIRPKEPKNRRLVLNGGQQNAVAIVSLVLLPLLGFLAAGWLWWQRR
ncbi:GldG family protein [Leptolyngbya sp. FACHB-261]|uniref:GldG family protein n=1 Tax=Leptolyngbya sp. FACHB-261 TaxID=2692806 RepID=UPI001684DC1A|nr:Gldg family protein [Leptolyngbya sp. FACHB-261]MBD2101438.1 GldG family protein [Leptolyngbya sp. FACHB-261]